TYANIALPEAYAYHAKTLQNMPEAYSDSVRSRLEMGRDISAGRYVQAQRDRVMLRREVDALLNTCDALVLPSLPIPAPKFGADTVRIGGVDEPLRPLMLRLTQLFTLTGHPAISLPCGDTGEGLPCALQLAGKHHATPEPLAIAPACDPLVTP